MDTEKLNEVRDIAIRGVGADTLLSVLGPLIEKRFEAVLGQLFSAAPTLENMLDARAQLRELWRVRHELQQVRQEGKDVSEALKQMYSSN